MKGWEEHWVGDQGSEWNPNWASWSGYRENNRVEKQGSKEDRVGGQGSEEDSQEE